ncbi:phage distal tail protein [Cellulosimicrobium sp. 22601]|uniref:phage distal tail protein n=1 Tax=unclassified Cellulosimicrobium TaxID=2624466 RepID=UPI003F838272
MTEALASTLSTVPDLEPWQAQLGSLRLGPGTPYEWAALSGVDELPALRTNDTDRPAAHGTWTGDDLASGRTIEFTIEISDEPELAVSLDQALADLRRVFVPTPRGVLVPFWINIPRRGAVICWAVRVRRRRIVTDLQYEMGLAVAEAQLFAPDPVGYGPQESTSARFPELVGGLAFDLFTDGAADTGFLEFGERGETGRVRLRNDGDADAYGLFHVEGPAVEGFELVAVGVGRRIRWEGSLFPGDLLTVDPARGTALLNGTADRSGLFTRREWFAVPPGKELEVQFLPVGASTGARLSVTYSSAWW